MMHFESETRIYAAVFRSHHCYFPLRTIVTHVDVPYYAQTNGFKVVVHGLLHVKRKSYDRIGEVLPFGLSSNQILGLSLRRTILWIGPRIFFESVRASGDGGAQHCDAVSAGGEPRGGSPQGTITWMECLLVDR